MTPAPVRGVVLYDYSAVEEDELSLGKGDTITILETYDDDWWMVKVDARVGLAPSNYTRMCI